MFATATPAADQLSMKDTVTVQGKFVEISLFDEVRTQGLQGRCGASPLSGS